MGRSKRGGGREEEEEGGGVFDGEQLWCITCFESFS